MSLKKVLLVATCFCFVGAILGQTINNIPPPLCGLKPGEEKHHVIKDGPKLYRGKLFNKLEQIPIGQEHVWFLYLEDMDSQPLEYAKIQADGINYDAGRGVATPPSVSHHIGNGHYLVEKVKFSVAGTWTMVFQILKDGAIEIIPFEIEIDDHFFDK